MPQDLEFHADKFTWTTEQIPSLKIAMPPEAKKAHAAVLLQLVAQGRIPGTTLRDLNPEPQR